MRKLKQKQKQSQSVVVNVNAPKRRSTRKSARNLPPRQPERQVQPFASSPYGKLSAPTPPAPPTLTELLTALRQPAPVKVEAPTIEKTPTATTAPSLGSFFTPFTGERPRPTSKEEKSLVPPIVAGQPYRLPFTGEPLLNPKGKPTLVSSQKEKTIGSALDQSFFGIPSKTAGLLTGAVSGFGSFLKSAAEPEPQSLPGHGLEDDPLERDAKTPAAKVFVSPTPPVSYLDELAARKKPNPSTGLPPVPAAPTGGYFNFGGSLAPESGGLPASLAPKEEQPKTASTLVPSLGLVSETETLVDKSTAYAEVLPPEEEEGFVDVEEEPVVVKGEPEVSLSPELPLDLPQGEFTALVPSPQQIAESAQTAPLFAASPAPTSALDVGGGVAKFEPDIGSNISSLGGRAPRKGYDYTSSESEADERFFSARPIAPTKGVQRAAEVFKAAVETGKELAPSTPLSGAATTIEELDKLYTGPRGSTGKPDGRTTEGRKFYAESKRIRGGV